MWRLSLLINSALACVAVMLLSLLFGQQYFIGHPDGLWAAENTIPRQPPSQQLLFKLEAARRIALEQIPGVKSKRLYDGALSPFYGDPINRQPLGIMASFTIQGSYRETKFGAIADKAIVIFFDDPRQAVIAKTTSVWLRDGLNNGK
ncbi:MAG: hypothetical protein JO316_25520 [Abitibacteriaceae bacterium]|nr:hypothetical protein [Abditibacteriaceae bacterium]